MLRASQLLSEMCSLIGERRRPKADAEEDGLSARYRLVVLGSPRVGKSSLISKFLYGKFAASYSPTQCDLHAWETRRCRVEIVDTSGSRDSAETRQRHISAGHIFVLVHSLGDPASFEAVLRLLEAIERLRPGERLPVFVIGNKRDQRSAGTMSLAEAELRLMDYMDVVRYAETDCSCAGSVAGAFSEVLRPVLGPDLRAEELLRRDSDHWMARKLDKLGVY